MLALLKKFRSKKSFAPDLVERAKNLATTAHGHAVNWHLAALCKLADRYCQLRYNKEHVVAAAWMHRIIQTPGWDLEKLSVYMPPAVVNLVGQLTPPEGEEPYSDAFFIRISRLFPEAKFILVCDLAAQSGATGENWSNESRYPERRVGLVDRLDKFLAAITSKHTPIALFSSIAFWKILVSCGTSALRFEPEMKDGLIVGVRPQPPYFQMEHGSYHPNWDGSKVVEY